MGGPGKPPARKRPPADPVKYLRAVILGASGLLIALPALSDGFLGLTKPVQTAESGCRVLQVIDGDTLRLWCDGRNALRARLLGFDTPELFSPSCPSEAAKALAAKWYLRWEIFKAGEVSMVREGTDRYDRALVRVFLDGAPLDRRMINAGYARSYSGGQRTGWCT